MSIDTPFGRSLLYTSILANCLTAGSVFLFPLFGPSLTRTLGLTLTQTNAISLGAICGQYAAAVGFGSIADYSSRLSSFCGAILFAAGWLLMAHSLNQEQPPSFLFFVAYFALVGTGTVASYFAALTASAKSFPRYPGLAIGLPSALFGISPLLLSMVASALFTRTDGEDQGEIDAGRLFTAVAILLATVNLFSSVVLQPIVHGEPVAPTEVPEQAMDSGMHGSETQPLLPKSEAASLAQTKVSEFLQQNSVWIFICIVLLLNGPSEVISQNLGSLSEALFVSPPTGQSHWPDRGVLVCRKRQIQIFSAVNTLSRLCFGALSDFTCPSLSSTALADSGKSSEGRRRWTTPRLSYLQLSALLLCAASLYTALGTDSTDSLWVLSTLAGMSYGLINVVGPSLVSRVYGPSEFGRNFGIIWTIAVIGPIAFGLMYGGVSDHFARRQASPACKGRICFEFTFLIIAAGSMIAFGLITFLKRRKEWQKV